MTEGRRQEELDRDFAEALERDRDEYDDRCPDCGGRLVETRSTANRRCADCGVLVGQAAA